VVTGTEPGAFLEGLEEPAATEEEEAVRLIGALGMVANGASPYTKEPKASVHRATNSAYQPCGSCAAGFTIFTDHRAWYLTGKPGDKENCKCCTSTHSLNSRSAATRVFNRLVNPKSLLEPP
jgi:hypothetical protein